MMAADGATALDSFLRHCLSLQYRNYIATILQCRGYIAATYLSQRAVYKSVIFSCDIAYRNFVAAISLIARRLGKIKEIAQFA
jgi:hypothetical protein